jgi:hypothetical protein
MRPLSMTLAALALILPPSLAVATEATTTRIETRPFYGATVTLEAGVRVFRPLPPHSKVIINPGGKAPVSLGFEENRFISHNYNYQAAPAAAAGPNDEAFLGGISADHRHAHRHKPIRRGELKGGKH